MKTNAKLYVMRRPDGCIKLGHSRNPETRRRQLAVPGLELVHETDVIEQAERTERIAHRVLALHGKHIRGEWFEATLDQAITAIEIAVRQAEAQELMLCGQLTPRVPVDERAVPISFRLSTDLLARLDRWLAKQDVPPTRTAVVEAALREFLDRRERKGKK